MRNLVKISIAVSFVVLIFGCGMSREQIGETTKISMQETLNSNPELAKWKLKVIGVQVFKQSENRYQGLAKIVYEGTPHDVAVDITVDGSNVMWKTDQGALLFVAQKEFQKLHDTFTY